MCKLYTLGPKGTLASSKAHCSSKRPLNGFDNQERVHFSTRLCFAICRVGVSSSLVDRWGAEDPEMGQPTGIWMAPSRRAAKNTTAFPLVCVCRTAQVWRKTQDPRAALKTLTYRQEMALFPSQGWMQMSSFQIVFKFSIKDPQGVRRGGPGWSA